MSIVRPLFRWQRARWTREHPGRTGLAVMAALPLLYLLPLQTIGMFAEWRDGAATLAFVLPLVLAGILVRDSARVPPAAVWLFQKGVRIEDVLLVRWGIDLGLVCTVGLWGAAGMLAGSALHETAVGVSWIAQVTVGGWLVASAASVFLFGVAAAGSARGSDLLVLLAFASLLEPLFTLMLGPSARGALHALLLPVTEAASLPREIGERPAAAVHAAAHLAVWTSIWLAFGVWRLRRWRPALGLLP